MRYPDNIINALVEEYTLDPEQIQALNQVLTTEGIQALVETQKLAPTALLYAGQYHEDTHKKTAKAIISIAQTHALLSTFKALGERFFDDNRLTLDHVLLWLEHDTHIVTTVPSEMAIKNIQDNLLQINDWRTTFLEDQKNAIEWIKLKQDLVELESMRPSQIREKKALPKTITYDMKKGGLSQFILKNTLLLQEHFALTEALMQHINARIEPLEQAASSYFETLFSHDRSIEEIKFFQKPDGAQLGRKLTITYHANVSPNPSSHSKETESEGQTQTISFFIKTHQHGSMSGHSGGSVRPVDPKELFVYRLLEYLGYGPKVHFFFNPLSTGGFFIATQDCGFTKTPGKKKLFETYASLNKNGLLANLDALTEKTMQALSCMDILSRIFRLRDITTNTTNFGRVTSGDSKKWKIIDFRVETADNYEYVDIFGGFIAGNGMYNYVGLLGKVLRDRPEAARLATAAKVMEAFRVGQAKRTGNDRKMPLIKAISKAFDEIDQYVRDNAQALNITEVASAAADLARFRTAAIRNFNTLSARVDAYRAQTPSETPSQCRMNF